MELIEAIKNNKIDEVKYLLKNSDNNSDNNINYKNEDNGWTALIWGIYRNNKDIVKLLLTYNADINIVSHRQEPALNWAAYLGYKDIVELLLAYKPAINIHDWYGNTELYWACLKCHKDIVELLLNYDLLYNKDNNKIKYVDGINNYGYTALIRAVYKNNKDIVKLLLKYDADINIKNNKGETALMIANELKYYEIKNILLEHLYKSVYIINIYTLKYHYYYDINISEIIYNYIKK